MPNDDSLATAATECRYPSHEGYGGPEDECIHCQWLTVDEIAERRLSRQASPEGS